MRSICSAVLLGLLVVVCLQSRSEAQNGKSPFECCFNFYTRRIPVATITSYEETRVDCPKSGVIFVTKRGNRICADPGLDWVKKAMNKLDLQFLEGSA